MLPVASAAISQDSVLAFHCSVLPHRSQVRSLGRRSVAFILSRESASDKNVSCRTTPSGPEPFAPEYGPPKRNLCVDNHPDIVAIRSISNLIFGYSIFRQYSKPAKLFISCIATVVIDDTNQCGCRPIHSGDGILRVR